MAPDFLFLRRQGSSPEDAQDLTQGFFAHLIESRACARADREKGRFRSFLLGTLKHFVAHARAHDSTQRRGGGAALLHLDETTLALIEQKAVRSSTSDPEHAYDREWAAALLHQVVLRLEEEAQLAGKAAIFRELGAYLAVGTDSMVPYDELATRLSRPAGTLRSDVARLRARYRAILREEVRGTVTTADEVDEELQYLRRVIAG